MGLLLAQLWIYRWHSCVEFFCSVDQFHVNAVGVCYCLYVVFQHPEVKPDGLILLCLFDEVCVQNSSLLLLLGFIDLHIHILALVQALTFGITSDCMTGGIY